MIGIGDLLRQTREEKNLTLADVEQEIKIRSRYLEALEAEEFDILPGNVYLYGFLRSYATFLGLDATELVSQVKSHLQENEAEPEVPKVRSPVYTSTTGNIGKKIKLLAIGLAICLLLVYFLSYFANQPVTRNDDPPMEQPIIEEALDETEPQETDNSLAETPALDGLELTLTVADQPGARCWVEIRADGETVFSGTLEAGDSKTFNAEEKLWVKAGNAGVLSATYNGKELETLGSSGEVVVLEFPLDNGW